MNKWLKSDRFLKVLAVGLAMMLWVMVNEEALFLSNRDGSPMIIQNVTLEAQYDESVYKLVEVPKTVDLNLSGDRSVLNQISPDQYRAYIDLKKLKPGKHENIPVQLEGIPARARAQVNPTSVTVVLAELQQKEMSIDVTVVGSPPEGYKAGDPVLKPSKVLVRGTESQLEEATSVKAVANIEGAKETITKSVELQVYGEGGLLKDVQVKPSVVDVEVPVAAPNTSVPMKIDIDRQLPSGYAIADIEANVDEVIVYGPKGYIKELSTYTGPGLDLSDVKSDRTFELPIPVRDDAVKVEPEMVRVTVKVVKSKTKKVEELPIKANGLDKELKAEISSTEGDTIAIRLEGAPDRLKKVKKEDITAYIDVANLKEGTYKRKVQFQLPPYIRIQGNVEMEATVTIQQK
ncbi:YbbR-like domain-containing protein [Mechercharimyces sp. CAU 1602]|uniref:CdaR family protein n=1 Tax=Mechercharimyces sp. CAU 1602 TaxID=2973933 RepID=UPI002162AEB4|nr:CdaR family protein [Mechercharimyces sp. CAU 1602]MCS1352086.1 CdaR family protein [Mechercharimyces sp. CAU 1602]